MMIQARVPGLAFSAAGNGCALAEGAFFGPARSPWVLLACGPPAETPQAAVNNATVVTPAITATAERAGSRRTTPIMTSGSFAIVIACRRSDVPARFPIATAAQDGASSCPRISLSRLRQERHIIT